MSDRYAHRRADGSYDIYDGAGRLIYGRISRSSALSICPPKRGWRPTSEQRESERKARVNGASDEELALRAISGR